MVGILFTIAIAFSIGSLAKMYSTLAMIRLYARKCSSVREMSLCNIELIPYSIRVRAVMIFALD